MDTSNMNTIITGETFIGRVKWFNNKVGFGFITITDGPRSGNDIFVHHSAIKVDAEQYKYLVQGEYVEFQLNTTSDGSHEYQAGNVSGIKGGKLMCETRREFKTDRNNYKEVSTQEELIPRSTRPPASKSYSNAKVRGSGPREGGEWSYDSKSKKNEKVPYVHKMVR